LKKEFLRFKTGNYFEQTGTASGEKPGAQFYALGIGVSAEKMGRGRVTRGCPQRRSVIFADRPFLSEQAFVPFSRLTFSV
jgi:hypothetical protein